MLDLTYSPSAVEYLENSHVKKDTMQSYGGATAMID